MLIKHLHLFLYEGEAYSIRRVKREKYDKKCRKADKVVDVGRGRLYNYTDTWVMASIK